MKHLAWYIVCTEEYSGSCYINVTINVYFESCLPVVSLPFLLLREINMESEFQSDTKEGLEI